MRVAILYNQPLAEAAADDLDVLVQRDAVGAALTRLGHSVSDVPCTLDLEDARQRLTADRPDVVCNLVESLGGSDRMMPLATVLLDGLHLPYTGCHTSAIIDSSDKIRAKSILQAAGLPTPDWTSSGGRPRLVASAATGTGSCFQSGPAAASPSRTISRPWIIKAIAEHASLGLDDASIVTPDSPDQLTAWVCERSERLGRPCFAEQYIAGREFNLSLLDGDNGPQVLPPAEIDFSRFPAGKPRIVGYAAKWDAASAEYQDTPRRFDFPDADSPQLAILVDLARRCWQVFGLSGYARVDFRLDAAGRPWILELNANPCLSPDAGFAAALERGGISFDAAIERILRAALP